MLDYSETAAMTRNLDDDEKGLQIVQTLGGDRAAKDRMRQMAADGTLWALPKPL